MTLPQKKLLATVVIVEVSVLCLVLWSLYPQVSWWVRKIRHGETHRAVIRKETLRTPEHSVFQYYSLLTPDTQVSEQPEWLPEPAVSTYNADGLNDRYNYEVARQENTLRIIALGDSFTYGHYVNTAESWPEVLEVQMNNTAERCRDVKRVEVLNLGVHGFDIPYLTQRYRDVGSKYQPDLILWFESGTGFTRLSELEAVETALCEEQLRLEGVEDLSRCWETNKDAVQAKYSKQQLDEYIGRYLTHFLQDTESQGVPVFFYAFTHLPEQDLHTLEQWVSPYSNTQVIATVPSIYERQGDLPDGHPNTAGHRLIAESIYHNLLESYCRQ